MTQNILRQMPFSIVSPNTSFCCDSQGDEYPIQFNTPIPPNGWSYLGFAATPLNLSTGSRVSYGTIMLVQPVNNGDVSNPPLARPLNYSSTGLGQSIIYQYSGQSAGGEAWGPFNQSITITQVIPPNGYVSIGLAAGAASIIEISSYMCVRADLCIVVPPSSLTFLGNNMTSPSTQYITYWQLPYSGYVVASMTNFNNPNLPYPPSPIYDLNPNT